MSAKTKTTEKGEKKSQKKNAKKRKDTRNESLNTTLQSEITGTVVLIPKEMLQDKTLEGISRVHSLTVCMLKGLAEQKGFLNHQFVTLTTKGEVLPAHLIIDSKMKENVAIIKDETSNLLCEGEDVVVTSQCSKLFAEEVKLCLLNTTELSESAAFLAYLKEQLVNQCLVLRIGMIIIISYLSQDIVLQVKDLKIFAINDVGVAKVPFQCIWQTCIYVENQKTSEDNIVDKRVCFDFIGGYKTILQDLQEEIQLFMYNSGSKMKKTEGILISGPSGCGKSLIGEALKSKYSTKFLSMQIEDVKSKFIGETEQNLKKLFDKAVDRAPCILFIDDIDILCSSRDRKGSTGTVTALLHLMDGVTGNSSRGVLVVATASDPKSLDAALRRPGRLSQDLCLQAPTEVDRQEILEKMLHRVPSNLTDSDLHILAARTPGYVGGDLRRVIMEAIVQADGKAIDREMIQTAITVVRPAALLASNTADREVQLSDIHGYGQLKHHLQESVNLTLCHSAIFQDCGISPPSRFFLFGPPGCGKTALVMAIATEFHLNVIPVKRSTVLGKYFGESEQNLAKVFQKAQESSPCIILFENFDGLAGTKSDGGVDVENRIINHLKVQLDGIVRNDSVFIFAETNRPDLVNKDLIRPGRFHEYHFINLPDQDDRQALLSKNLTSSLQEMSLDQLVDLTKGFTVSEIIQFCEELRTQDKESAGFSNLEDDTISRACIEDALETIVPNTSLKMMSRYHSFAQIYCSSGNKDTFR
ncbi:nuclear valosin-containing protein-like [Penaeus monodon]|uniref:nuclear valosin-containing protein-like n=1 Tax=Penaeus monodon TaxID=6687 RepID=UPI0018A6F673|nr:nuclear valosin-containing protein-like [Penaeus monodon]XP_037781608.1 nuclear valosin-containing protein-like [Penaeus monodon]XP_037781609.1 nuclear valosin-containing protein-like [Penaeus monodon]